MPGGRVGQVLVGLDRRSASRQFIVLTFAPLTAILPVRGDLPERDRRLKRNRVKEPGQADAAVQANLVVPLGEGVPE
jgi:hypothetical protein